MSARVRAWIHPELNLYHASMVYTGLLGLHEQGRAHVQFLYRDTGAADPLVVLLDYTRDGVHRRLAIDLYDRSDVIASQLLEQVDVYLKRSYYEPDVRRCCGDLARKVQAFGLNYGCRGHAVTARLAATLGPRQAWRLLRLRLQARSRFDEAWHPLKQFLTLPNVADYEWKPEEAAEPVVLFQTRVWEPEKVYPDSPEEINEGRVALVRALRAAFGARFCGGLIPTPYARQHYPDALTEQQTRRNAYIAMSKRALIGVYCRGLHHSLAFKLPEYLASSKAIVAEAFRHQLPRPLEEGTHYLGFRDADECVARCRELLNDSVRTAAMRQANWRYYREEVEPAAHLRKCLELASA